MNLLKTFFYSLKRSLFDPKYYKDVAKVNFWFSFKYLWFLLFIFTIVNGIVLGGKYIRNRPFVQPRVNKFLTNAKNFYPTGLELKIKNGQLSTNVNEPYIFDIDEKEWGKAQQHFLIIDTNGSIENYPNYNTHILATRNAVVYPSESNNNRVEQTSVFYFRDLKQNLTLNKNVYNNFFNMVQPYSNRILYLVDYIVLMFLFLFMIFGSLFWAGGVMIRLLFLNLLVWVVSLVFKKGYNYSSLFKMGMHAVTWPLLINEVLKYTNSPFPRSFSMIFFVWIFIVLFSTEKNNRKKTK